MTRSAIIVVACVFLLLPVLAKRPVFDELRKHLGYPATPEPEYCIFKGPNNKTVDLGRVPTAFLRLDQHQASTMGPMVTPYDFVIALCRPNMWAYKVFTPGCDRPGLIQQYVPETAPPPYLEATADKKKKRTQSSSGEQQQQRRGMKSQGAVAQTCQSVFNSDPVATPPPYTVAADGASLTLAISDAVNGFSGTLVVRCGPTINLHGERYALDATGKVFTFEVSTAAACFGDVPEEAPNNGAFPPMWPQPRRYSNGTASVVVSGKVEMAASVDTAAGRADIAAAWARFTERAMPHVAGPDPATGAVATVSVTVKNGSVPLQLGVDESYTLSIDGSSGISIAAATVYGAYHGLESLSQLMGFDFDSQTYVIRHAPWVIDDAPRFPHRGLLIDTTRHFLPLQTIKRVVDSLTYAKLNTLHWHIVDAQSFPFQGPTFPQLAQFGAWSRQERFTANDVKAVVEYARARGVRVMIEFDTPGHSASLCDAFPDICPIPPCKSTNINNWALDFTKNKTYDVIFGVWKDFANLFPERLMHLGGDEVDYWCWQHHPEIQAWLAARGMTDTDGYEYYIKKVEHYLWNLPGDRAVVGWEEIWNHFGTSLDNRTIIQQWLPHSTALPKNVTSHGYRLIWSDASKWYFDHLELTWKQVYDAEPCDGLTDTECGRILGGEGCQWGETVDTSDIMQTVWPRLGAVAERLWSPRVNATAAHLATRRMLGFRCLLNQRGIAAAPVHNLAARQPPNQPGSCYWQ